MLVKGCCGIITTAALSGNILLNQQLQNGQNDSDNYVYDKGVNYIEQECIYGAYNSSDINKHYVKWWNKYSKAEWSGCC